MTTLVQSRADRFQLAVDWTDFSLDDLAAIFSERGQWSEVAERVKAQSGRDVTDTDAAAWLTAEAGFPECGQSHGRGVCERPCRHGSTRCIEHERH